jgi:20S proteasome subunit alpha 6
MTPNELAEHQEKVFDIDDHLGMVFSGLTADARYLCKFMRNESLNYWYGNGSQHPIERMVNKIAKKSQHKTCHPSKRPFGVGVLIGGVDETGTHLFETCPSGNFYESKAMAIGAKCQSAKTYLEKNFETFSKISRDDLIKHGLKALKASAQEEELSVNNVSVGVVSASEKFHLLSESELQVILTSISEGMKD